MKELYVILHDIRSAYNVGAIFRTADGAGVKKIYLSGYTPCPFLPTEHLHELSRKEKVEQTKAEKMLAKTALGAEKTVLWEKYERIEDVLQKLQKEGVKIVALEKTAHSIDIKEFSWDGSLALILGNEVEGVSDEVLQKCDAIVALPMRGHKESLNVSVAAGIAMYELLF